MAADSAAKRKEMEHMVTFREVSIKDIVPYDNNPRENAGAVEKVRNSIEDFGFRKPVVVDEDMVILAGHTRILALKRMGVTRVAVAVVSGLTEEQKTAYRIKDNRAGELSLFDFSKVAEEMKSLPGVDMTRYGFEPPKGDEVRPPTAEDEVGGGTGGDDGAEADGRAVLCPRCGKVVR